MSTYLHLACLSHNPPLLAENESTQHRHNEREMADVKQWVADRVRVVDDWHSGRIKPWYECVDSFIARDYYLARTVPFLVQHVDCRIGAQDEYGVWVDVGEGMPQDGAE